MDRLLEPVRLHRLGTNAREVARLLRMSPNTERRYRLQLIEAGLLEGRAEDLPSREALRVACPIVESGAAPEHERSTVEAWGERIAQLWNSGAGPQAIRDRLRIDATDFNGSFSAVKRYCLRLRRERGIEPNDVVIPVEVVLGEAPVDFGYVGKLLRSPAQPAPQRVGFRPDFGGERQDGHAHRLRPDGVDVAAAAHRGLRGARRSAYGDRAGQSQVGSDPCGLRPRIQPRAQPQLPPAREALRLQDRPDATERPPKKKGRVEVSVSTSRGTSSLRSARPISTKRDVSSPDGTPRSPIVVATAAQAGRPSGSSDEAERATLRPLPARRFEPVVWKKAKVHRDCHISFDRRRYSVPWRLVGKEVWIRATMARIEVHLDDVRIATHQRS